MKLSTLILIALLTSPGIGHPYRQHVPHHFKRQDIVWATHNNFVTETVDITTTIWVEEGFVSGSKTVSTSSSSAYDCRVSASTLMPAASAPVESHTSISPAVVDVINKSTTKYNSPKASTSSAPAPGATSSSSFSKCSSEFPCEGDITYYTAGLGACGITSDGDVQKVVALPHVLMGPESNDNPYCGKTITITCIATSRTTTTIVADKCMGCEGFSIDLSIAAFLDLDDLAVGRTNATWYFN